MYKSVEQLLGEILAELKKMNEQAEGRNRVVTVVVGSPVDPGLVARRAATELAQRWQNGSK